MRLFRKWAISLGLSVVAAATSAAPLHYDEASQGDLPEGPVVTAFSLDSGVNVVEGTLQSQIVIDSFGEQRLLTDFDPFQLVLPAGLRLESVQANLSFIGSTANAGQLTLAWFATVSPGSSVFQTCFEFVSAFNPSCITSATGGALFPGLPDQATSYLVQQGFALGYVDPNLPVGGFYDYTFTAVVSSVPEPSSFALALVAAAATLARRRKLRRSKKT